MKKSYILVTFLKNKDEETVPSFSKKGNKFFFK